MDVHAFEDAGPFAREAAPYLEDDPFSSSVIAVRVDAVLRGVREPGPLDRYWSVVEGDRTVGIAMRTPPNSMFLARMPTVASVALAHSLAEDSREVPGVNGELQTVAAFADAWTRLTGQRSSTVVSTRMYRLAELTVPTGVSGQSRSATKDDVEVIAAWLDRFHEEAQPHAPRADWRLLTELRIRAGQLMLWENEQQPVSVAGFSKAVAGVSRVGPVFTPSNHRKRGFGAAVTADATAAALHAGARHVVLYTDLSNPTSNAIYQTIGYRPDHDAEERTFHPES